MTGTKAIALEAWARRTGRAYLRFDYLGHGQSSGRFEDGTIGRWLDDSLAAVDSLTSGKLVLVGSSMGGYLASLYAARHPEVQKLVLLAPAFGFQNRWPAMLGPEKFQAWERTGELEVFHYGDKVQRSVGWQLAEDARKWDPIPHVTQPTLLFHGTNDLTVPIAGSEAYAATHPNVTMEAFDAGHELTEVIDEMWERTAIFLGIGRE